MAMIKCPECGQDVSSKAPSCPKCGNPINMKSGPFGGHEKGVTVRPGFWHDPNVGAIGCFVLVIIIVINVILALAKR
jgi:zinc-ribbon domain